MEYFVRLGEGIEEKVGNGRIRKDWEWVGNRERSLLRNMARTSRGKLVGIDEKSTVRITRVQGEHSVVNILLGTFGVVTGSQKSAGRVGGLTGFQAGGLGIVIVTISVVFGDMLEDNSPVPFNIDGTFDFGVFNGGRAEVALRSDPVGGIIGRRSLGSSSVIIVVESSLLGSNDVLNQVIGRLVGDIRVFFQENRVLGDLVGDFVVGILSIS